MSRMTTRNGLINQVLDVLSKGYRPYRGHVDDAVYETICCDSPEDASWFEHERRFICLGCQRHCALVDPPGMQLTIPMKVKSSYGVVMLAQLPSVTVDEILATGRPLRPDEAAWALNVSTREIYYMVEDGRLNQAGSGRPLRVTSDSVRRELTGRSSPGPHDAAEGSSRTGLSA